MGTRVQYNKIPPFRRYAAYAAGGLMLAAAGAIIVKFPPDKWWVEAGVIGLVWTGLFIIGAWIGQRKKWGVILATGIVSLLILERFRTLNLWTWGIFIIILGLISLIN